MIDEDFRIPRGYKVEARSIKDIRRLAHRIREIFGIKKPYLEVIKIVDVLAAEGFIELEILPDGSLMDEEWGQTKLIKVNDELKPQITLEQQVYNGADLGDGFHRFTVAHEIGHALMHVQDLKFSRSTEHREKKIWFIDSEWQANTFAAEFLADIRFIKPTDTIESIACKFGISKKAADIRLMKINGKE